MNMASYIVLILVPVSLLFITVNAETQGQSLSEYMWEQTKGERYAALNSSVIQGMVLKNLSPAKFSAYMVQDVVYLFNSHRIINIANSRKTNQMYADLLKEMEGTYQWLYEVTMKDYHIKYSSGIRLGPEITKYLHHLYDMAANFDTGYFITAMLPCYKLWPWLGIEIGATKADFGVYTDWVEVNLDPTSSSYRKLEDHINRAEEAGLIDRELALVFFRRSMQNEVDFFSSV